MIASPSEVKEFILQMSSMNKGTFGEHMCSSRKKGKWVKSVLTQSNSSIQVATAQLEIINNEEDFTVLIWEIVHV